MPPLPRRARAHVFTTLFALLTLGAALAAQDVGFVGPSFEGANGSPTASKPESKLWFVDGAWWGLLWSAATRTHSIHRLDLATQSWIDTEVACDARAKSRADVLWNGSKLYVASHEFTSGAGTGGEPLLLYRYGYRPSEQRFALDSGFPVEIGDSTTETLVVDQDSTGRLWAVWMRDLRVFVAHTQADEREWSAPAVLPSCTSDVSSDDVCALIHFGDTQVGVLWSDEPSDAFWFSAHADGSADDLWSARVPVLAGPDLADDHVQLKASADGRVFAALKTGTDEIRLAVRATNGSWSTHLVSAAAAQWTRPILALNETDRQIYCLATSPTPSGAIRRKFSSLDSLGFATGIGTAVLQSTTDPSYNDATTTKQGVDGESGLVVLASQLGSRRYGHGFLNLGGPPAVAPSAAFGADPVTGYAPLRVQFLDGSRGGPTAWAWSFGDGRSASTRHPALTYAVPGTYSVALTVTNALGTDTETRNALVTVLPAPSALTLTALEDSQVREASPSSNYGSLTTMRVRADPSSDYHAFLKFFVPETPNLIASARLRLWVEDGGPDGGTLYATSGAWSQSLLTWENAPAFGSALTSFGAVTTGTWVERDVDPGLLGAGLASFGIANADSNSIFYSSREGSHPPELALVFTLTGPPSAAFEGFPLHGPPPLAVQFFDRSSGPVTSFLWDFGDGTTSTLENPSHVYGHPGTYAVSLTVTNTFGSDAELKAGYVTVLSYVRRSGPP